MLDSFIEKVIKMAIGAGPEEVDGDVEAADVWEAPPDSDSKDIMDAKRRQWTPSRKELLIMVTCSISSLVVALDATILVPVLPTLALELDGTAAEAFWTGTSYLLTHAVFQPFIATMSDIFGRRELLIPSISFFTIGSIVCAVAQGFTILLLGRVIQGIGGAGIITLSQIIFADLIPLRQRPKYFSLVLGAWALGSILGPLIGGVFVEKSTWRWCFWLNLPICGIALVMTILFVKLHQPAKDFTTKLKSVDWIGNTLFIASLTSFLIAICWAGIQYSWSSAQTVVPLIFGIFGIIGTIFYEMRYASQPFLKRSIFRGRSVIASYIAATLQGLALYMALYYGTFYFSAAQLFGPIKAGVSIFPATTFLLPGSVIVSALITRTARFRWAIWAGFAISTLATGLFTLWDENTLTAVWAVCLCLFGLGMGMVLSSVNFSIQANVEPVDCGAAAAMYAFMRSVGMTLGVAVGGTVFQNVMKRKLVDLGVRDAAEIARHAEGFVEQLRGMSVDGPQAEVELRQDIMDGYVEGFRGVWIVMTVLCALGLVVSLGIKRGSLDAVLVTKFRVVGDDGDGDRDGDREVEAEAEPEAETEAENKVAVSEDGQGQAYSNDPRGGAPYYCTCDR